MSGHLSNVLDHLMTRLDAVCDDDLAGEQLETELRKSDAATKLSAQIINGGKLELDARKLALEHGLHRDTSAVKLPKLLEQPSDG